MAKKISPKKLIYLRIIATLLLLGGSERLRRLFASYKKPPAKSEQTEKTFVIDGLEVHRGSHRVVIDGYGVIHSSERVNISPEVSGVIIYVNPALEVGVTVEKETTLVKIDPTDYQLAVEREKARILTLNSQIKELQLDVEFTRQNIALYEKEVALTQKNFDRQKDMAQKGIGSQLNEESSERAYVVARSNLLTAKQRLASSQAKVVTLKNQIKEVENILNVNLNNLAKCTVKSPARLRVTAKNAEVGQLANPAAPLLTLESDDSLEIPVMIPGPDAIKWLNVNDGSKNLFEALKQTEADIIWTEASSSKVLGRGVLTRIEHYHAANRMVRALVKVDELNFVAAPGMFCKVRLKGKNLTEVYKVPRVAMTKDNMLMTIEKDRLKFVKTVPVFNLGDFIIVRSEYLAHAVIVLNSKLANPIEGLKVKLETVTNERK